VFLGLPNPALHILRVCLPVLLGLLLEFKLSAHRSDSNFVHIEAKNHGVALLSPSREFVVLQMFKCRAQPFSSEHSRFLHSTVDCSYLSVIFLLFIFWFVSLFFVFCFSSEGFNRAQPFSLERSKFLHSTIGNRLEILLLSTRFARCVQQAQHFWWLINWEPIVSGKNSLHQRGVDT
jgi:hypothetical protein